MEENSFNNVAIFTLKLWKMLSQRGALDIMYWSPSGKSFIIHNQALFITELLPMYFSHNNMGSFIRQLNLYDFHKVCLDNKSFQLEYHHKYFQRDRPDLLKHVKRKLPQYKRPVYSKVDQEELTNLSKEITALRKQQEETIKQMDLIKQENLALVKEMANLYAKYNSQNQLIKKIIETLIAALENKINSKCGISNEKIFEISSNIIHKMNSMGSWTVNHSWKTPSNAVCLPQENFNITNTDTVNLASEFMDLRDLLVNVNQTFRFNDDNLDENSDKTAKDALNFLDHEFTSLLENEAFSDNLFTGQSNGLDQGSRANI